MLRSLVLLAASVAAAVVSSAENNSIWEMCGLDIVGDDIGSAKNDNPDACPWICASTDRCKRVTWTSYHSGTCWFKALGISMATPTSDAVSYDLVYEPNQPATAAFVSDPKPRLRDLPNRDRGHASIKWDAAKYAEIFSWFGAISFMPWSSKR